MIFDNNNIVKNGMNLREPTVISMDDSSSKPNTDSHSDPHSEYINLQTMFGNSKYMIQEDITQLEHCLQAAFIADMCGAPKDVVVGLLYHDVGQLVPRLTDSAKIDNFETSIDYLHEHHDDLGCRWLEEKGFPKFVCDLVKYHTLAKVVICDRDPTYYESLSTASQISYHIQKKKFIGNTTTTSNSSNNQYKEFLEHRRLDDILAARLCDDMAKIMDLDWIPGIEYYNGMVDSVINNGDDKTYDEKWIDKIKELSQYMIRDRGAFESFIRGLNYIKIIKDIKNIRNNLNF